MDYSELDKVRRTTTPLQLDASSRLRAVGSTRREFIKRGTIVGLSMASISAVIAACGGTTTQPERTAAAARSVRVLAARRSSAPQPARRHHRRHDPHRLPASCRPARPGRDDRPGELRHDRTDFEFLCTLAPNATDIAPGLAESWTPNDDNSVWTFKLRSGVKWQDGKDFTSADVVATMDRLVAAGNSGIKGVLDKGSAVATDPSP